MSAVIGRETSGAAKVGAATGSATGGCSAATGRCTKKYIVAAPAAANDRRYHPTANSHSGPNLRA
jgi:hypothetical protein